MLSTRSARSRWKGFFRHLVLCIAACRPLAGSASGSDADFQVWMSSGFASQEREDYGAAAKAFATALRIRPGDPRAEGALGSEYRKMDRCAEAVGLLEDSLRHEPGNVLGFEDLAWCYRALGRLEDASSTLARAKKAAPRAKELYIWEGYFWADSQGIGPKTIKSFKQALAVDPEDPESNRHVGQYYLDIGDPARAKPYLEKSISQYIERKRYGEAGDAVDRLNRIDHDAAAMARAASLYERDLPNLHPGLVRQLAEIYLWQGRSGKASALYRDALTRCARTRACGHEGRAALLLGLAKSLQVQRRPAAAEAALDSALVHIRDIKNDQWHLRLAELYRAGDLYGLLGLQSKSEDCYRRIISVPDQQLPAGEVRSIFCGALVAEARWCLQSGRRKEAATLRARARALVDSSGKQLCAVEKE